QYLAQPHGVHGEDAQVLVGVDNETVLVLLGKLSGGADDLVDQRCELYGLWVELELAGLDLRQVEHLVDEAKEMSPSEVHALQRLLRLFCAEPRGVRDHHFGQSDDGIERRAKLVAHAGDELRLVLVRLCELATLVLDFVEQPHVLDRDHRLVGEGGHQLDLLVGKWAHGASHQHDHANRLAFTQQRNTEHRTVVADFRWLYKLVFRIGENVGYLNDSAFKRGPAGDSSSSQLDWIVPHILDKRGG